MLAPERYKGLQSGTHFELSLEGGYPVLGAGVGGHFRRTYRDWWAFGRAGGFGEGGKMEGVMARRSLREGENEVRVTKVPRVPGFWPKSIKHLSRK